MKEHWFNLTTLGLLGTAFIFTLGAKFDGGVFSYIFLGIWLIVLTLKHFVERSVYYQR